jgi:hypothetical protein
MKDEKMRRREDEKMKGNCGMSCGLRGTLDLSFPHAVHLEMIVIF